MREKKPYQVLTFHTTDAAMEMESFCKQNGSYKQKTAQDHQNSLKLKSFHFFDPSSQNPSASFPLEER